MKWNGPSLVAGPNGHPISQSIVQLGSRTCIANLSCVWTKQTFGKISSTIIDPSGQANKILSPSAPATADRPLIVYRKDDIAKKVINILQCPSHQLVETYMCLLRRIHVANSKSTDSMITKGQGCADGNAITWLQEDVEIQFLFISVITIIWLLLLPGCRRCECGSIVGVFPPTPTLLNPFEL